MSYPRKGVPCVTLYLHPEPDGYVACYTLQHVESIKLARETKNHRGDKFYEFEIKCFGNETVAHQAIANIALRLD